MSINAPQFERYLPRAEYFNEAGERFVEYRIGRVDLCLARTGLARVADKDASYRTLLRDVADVVSGSTGIESMADFHELTQGDYGRIYQHELEEAALWTGDVSTLLVHFIKHSNKMLAFGVSGSYQPRAVVAIEAMPNDELARLATGLHPVSRAQRRLASAGLTTTHLPQVSIR